MRRGRICQECKFESKTEGTKEVMQMYKLTDIEILVRKAGREKEKCTRMCQKEAQCGSGDLRKKQDLSEDQGGLV